MIEREGRRRKRAIVERQMSYYRNKKRESRPSRVIIILYERFFRVTVLRVYLEKVYSLLRGECKIRFSLLVRSHILAIERSEEKSDFHLPEYG